MASLRKESMDYEPTKTMNIVDLDNVSLDVFEVKDGSGERNKDDGSKETFTYKFIEKDGVEYRVPKSVLEEIQKILKIKPDVTTVKVDKSGSGLATKYTVEVVA